MASGSSYRIALISPPRPASSYINRDLYGGMGIDDNFGVDPGVSFVAFLKAEGTRIPELSFPYLVALLRRHTVRFFDGAREALGGAGDDALRGDVAEFRPDWIVASTSYVNLYNEARWVAALGAATRARTVLFGYAAHAFAAPLMEKVSIDLIVAGEVEAVLPALFGGMPPPRVPGLWWRRGARLQAPAAPSLVADLDALPFPDWSAVGLARYAYFPLLKERPFATLSSSRGCTYRCDYCPYWVAQGDRFRARAPESVVDEMEWDARVHGVRSLLFRDPSFGLDRARVLTLCREIVRRRLRLDWGAETRLDGIDDELAGWLARAGCRSVEVGMDSLSTAATAGHNRRTITQEAAHTRLAALAREGVASAGLFVIGLPGDTEADIRATFNLAEQLPLTYVNYEIPIPFPGTPMYARAVAEGRIPPVGVTDLVGTNPPLPSSKTLSPARLAALQNEGLRRFYVRPQRVWENLRRGAPVASARFLAGAALKFLYQNHIAPRQGGSGRSE